jgi:hypothetical protein
VAHCIHAQGGTLHGIEHVVTQGINAFCWFEFHSEFLRVPAPLREILFFQSIHPPEIAKNLSNFALCEKTKLREDFNRPGGGGYGVL